MTFIGCSGEGARLSKFFERPILCFDSFFLRNILEQPCFIIFSFFCGCLSDSYWMEMLKISEIFFYHTRRSNKDG